MKIMLSNKDYIIITLFIVAIVEKEGKTNFHKSYDLRNCLDKLEIC